MLWSKQYFFFDADKWLEEHGFDPMQPTPRQVRNREWFHMIGDHVISMPDKWEYPWFAAWDLAFHTLALSTVDIDFAKEQLDLLLRQVYLHSTGQIPAYEWNFSDVKPAGTGLVGDFPLPHGASAARPNRSRLPEASVRPAHLELWLVGQSQRPLRAKPLRRRVSRTRLYRRLRPQRAFADRRPSRAC
jgi:hypothetical protein